jgi:hypothetical protein
MFVHGRHVFFTFVAICLYLFLHSQLSEISKTSSKRVAKNRNSHLNVIIETLLDIIKPSSKTVLKKYNGSL